MRHFIHNAFMNRLQRSQVNQILELWNSGVSCRQIIDELNLQITVRQVQRIGAANGDWRKRWQTRMERHGERLGRRK
jgi:hypothetical protein